MNYHGIKIAIADILLSALFIISEIEIGLKLLASFSIIVSTVYLIRKYIEERRLLRIKIRREELELLLKRKQILEEQNKKQDEKD